MNRKKVLAALLPFFFAVAAVSTAQAATVSVRLKITASGIYNAGKYVVSQPYSVDPIVGDFTFSFDNTASFAGTASGVTVNSFNLPDPVGILYYQPTDTLQVASSFIGQGCTVSTGSNSFCFTIGAISKSPNTTSFIGAAPGVDGYLYATSLSTQIVGAAGAVPEAATWATMIVGLGIVGGSLRRRQMVSTRVSLA